MLAVSYLLGQRRRDSAMSEPYESGIFSTGAEAMITAERSLEEAINCATSGVSGTCSMAS